YCIIVLVIVFIFTYSAFILGLIIGVIGSLINTFTFEYYLAKAKEKDNIHISTGNIWRYLIVILACTTWYFYKYYINIRSEERRVVKKCKHQRRVSTQTK